jgi:AcrR family transcriptional regulator
MYTKQTNPVARRSQTMVADALISLLADGVAYTSITVATLCKRADLVRKTFYRNFSTKDDVVAFLLDNNVGWLFDGIDIEKLPMRETFLHVFKFMSQYKQFLSMFFQNNLFHLVKTFLVRMLHEVRLYGCLDKTKMKDYYYIYFMPQVVSMFASIIETWVQNDFAETAEELAAMSTAFFVGEIYAEMK